MKKVNCQMDGTPIISGTQKSVSGAISDLSNYFQAAIGKSDRVFDWLLTNHFFKTQFISRIELLTDTHCLI